MIIKDKFVEKFTKVTLAIRKAVDSRKDVKAKIDGEWYYFPFSDPDEMMGHARQHITFCRIARDAKPILFSSEQAAVFSDIAQVYRDGLDFRLPFENIFIQFSQPIHTPYQKRSDNDFDRGCLLAVAVEQRVFTKEQMEEFEKKDKDNGGTTIDYPKDSNEIYVNTISLLYGDGGTEFVRWASGRDVSFLFSDEVRINAMLHWKNVIIACVGYINCENIYLEKQGEVSEAVNRKREAKGKSRLEPYYVCRIKGVQHESHETGTGAKHGIRYDVRGHFRRLETGKTIWVRPHQRGLQNELYVPKVYKVEKGSKPQWKA